jgi:hypothetical protein
LCFSSLPRSFTWLSPSTVIFCFSLSDFTLGNSTFLALLLLFTFNALGFLSCFYQRRMEGCPGFSGFFRLPVFILSSCRILIICCADLSSSVTTHRYSFNLTQFAQELTSLPQGSRSKWRDSKSRTNSAVAILII